MGASTAIRVQVLAEKLAALENTKAAMVTSSGMAAISTTLMTLLKSGDHLLVQQSLYGGTEMFLTNDLPDWGVTLTRVDADKPESWSAALQPNTKVLRPYCCVSDPNQYHPAVNVLSSSDAHLP